VTLVKYELAHVDAVVKLNWLSAGKQGNVGWICGRRNGARDVLANKGPLKRISEVVRCRQVETEVRNSYNAVIVHACSMSILSIKRYQNDDDS